jgi:hypothetical protein
MAIRVDIRGCLRLLKRSKRIVGLPLQHTGLDCLREYGDVKYSMGRLLYNICTLIALQIC